MVYKITVAAVNYCRNDCFDIKGSGLPLVRIICHLCSSAGPVISSIFKMQLLDQCPVVRPHVSDVLPLDAYRDYMGFLSKKAGTGPVRRHCQLCSYIYRSLSIYGSKTLLYFIYIASLRDLYGSRAISGVLA